MYPEARGKPLAQSPRENIQEKFQNSSKVKWSVHFLELYISGMSGLISILPAGQVPTGLGACVHMPPRPQTPAPQHTGKADPFLPIKALLKCQLLRVAIQSHLPVPPTSISPPGLFPLEHSPLSGLIYLPISTFPPHEWHGFSSLLLSPAPKTAFVLYRSGTK